MKIYLLSSVYPAKYSPAGTTPVVHYFAKEWVKTGNEVNVFHTTSCFPKFYYLIGRLFKNTLYSKLGHLVPINPPKEYEETKDGVSLSHINLKKLVPHGRFPKAQIYRAFQLISSHIEKDEVPDVFIGHWDNPQLELLSLLKKRFQRATCLVFHANSFDSLFGTYGKDLNRLMNGIDLVGFRNVSAQANYEKLLGKSKHAFICASGVSNPFIAVGNSSEKQFGSVRKFAFVGSLINRKHPATVLEALARSYGQELFEVTFIGEGREKEHIQQLFGEYACTGVLNFTGRIPRDMVIHHLLESDVFVMISEGEIFGLVYLEAMALGCITIASRNEGVDGIIKNGVNGFLCESGNAYELSLIINRIRSMSIQELQTMSSLAKATANAYTDARVAENYLNYIRNII